MNSKFCGRSCAAKYNNRKFPKRKPTGFCKKCGEPNTKSRVYCSDCYHKIKVEKEARTHKKCRTCNQIFPLDCFHSIGGRYPRPFADCKVCRNRRAKEEQISFKKLCVEYKGGQCIKCGYDNCIAALEFHHTDTKKKDFQISSVRKKELTNVLREELDKCILLCANCPRTSLS